MILLCLFFGRKILFIKFACMKDRINQIASLLFFISAFVVVYAVYDVNMGHALGYSAIALAVQLLVWQLNACRTRIGYALTFIPAALVLSYICLGGHGWLIASGAATLFSILLHIRQFIATREGTQNWVAAAIFVCTLSALAAILI